MHKTYGLYNCNGLIDTCYESSLKKAKAHFRKVWNLDTLRGHKVWENPSYYYDNYETTINTKSYRQTQVK